MPNSGNVSLITKSQMIWRAEGVSAGKSAGKWSANSLLVRHRPGGGFVWPPNLFARAELRRDHDYGALNFDSYLGLKVRRGFGEAPRAGLEPATGWLTATCSTN